jgi:hypothetical protein
MRTRWHIRAGGIVVFILAGAVCSGQTEPWASVFFPDPLRFSSLPISGTEVIAPAPGQWELSTALGYFNVWQRTWHTARIHQVWGLVGKPLTDAEIKAIEQAFPHDQFYHIDLEGWRNDFVVSRGFDGGIAATLRVPWIEIGSPHWDAIAEVKQAVRIPVLGNGGVMCAADIERIKRHTGCDGVMIGHGAMGHPWIFQRRDREEISFIEKTAMMRRHLLAMVDYYGEKTGVVLFRKHAVRYLRGTPNITQLRIALLTHDRLPGVMQAIDAYEVHVCAVEAGEWQARLGAWKLENCLIEESHGD